MDRNAYREHVKKVKKDAKTHGMHEDAMTLITMMLLNFVIAIPVTFIFACGSSDELGDQDDDDVKTRTPSR
eukprot:3055407-Rhodomonas_salina.8